MAFRHLKASMRLVLAGLLIVVIALIDWRVDLAISFAFLYLLPVSLVCPACKVTYNALGAP